MYNPLPHHLELVVYLTQMQDDHLNDPLANSATCSKAKIGSKAEEASRPKKSCCWAAVSRSFLNRFSKVVS